MTFDISWLLEETPQIIIAGALGGLTRSLSIKDHSLREIAKNVVIGCTCGFYLSPVLQPALTGLLVRLTDVQPRAVAPLAGFMIGAGGLTVVTFFLDVVLNKLKRDSEK